MTKKIQEIYTDLAYRLRWESGYKLPTTNENTTVKYDDPRVEKIAEKQFELFKILSNIEGQIYELDLELKRMSQES